MAAAGTGPGGGACRQPSPLCSQKHAPAPTTPAGLQACDPRGLQIHPWWLLPAPHHRQAGFGRQLRRQEELQRTPQALWVLRISHHLPPPHALGYSCRPRAAEPTRTQQPHVPRQVGKTLQGPLVFLHGPRALGGGRGRCWGQLRVAPPPAAAPPGSGPTGSWSDTWAGRGPRPAIPWRCIPTKQHRLSGPQPP